MSGFRIEIDRQTVTLPNGRSVELDVIRHPGASAVVPFITGDEVLLIRQYRHAVGGHILEIPAGKLDPGDTPDACAHRELEEEAGVKAGRMVKLGSVLTTPGFSDEIIHLYAAFDLSRVGTRHEEDEIIEILQVSLDEALDLVWRGELRDGKSALALLHAARHVGRIA